MLEAVNIWVRFLLIRYNQDKGQRVVSARDLHYFLEIESKFADWKKYRIEKYEFIEDLDYVAFTKNLASGGKMVEYGLTLGMAKELFMVDLLRMFPIGFSAKIASSEID